MRPNKTKVTLLLTGVIFYLFFIPLIVNAQAIKTTIGDILLHPQKYDGKIVKVEGKVISLKFKTSKRGNPYTVFKIAEDNQSLTVFSFGTLPIKEGDKVRVVGKYQSVKQVGPYTFYDEIDASKGSVEKIE